MTQEINTKSVDEEEIFKDFCDDRELADRTIYLYTCHLQKYCNFVGKGLEELIEEAEEEQDENVKPRKRKLTKYLLDFKKYLEGYAPTTQNHIMISIKAFYNHYEIQLPRNARKNRSRKAKKIKKAQNIEIIPTMEEIQQFLECCNKTYKVIVLLGISSGMGRAEICSLTFKHLYDAIPLKDYPSDIPELIKKLKENEDFIPTWHIERIKTGSDYFTFSSPECTERLIEYLEALHFKYLDFKPEPEDYLIRSLTHNQHLTRDQVGGTLFLKNKHNGFRQYNKRYVCSPHGFRRFFASTLERNKMPHLTTRHLLGHVFENTTNAYFKIDPETAKEDYLEVVNELSVSNVEAKTVESPAFKELKEMSEKNAKELELLKELIKSDEFRRDLAEE